MPFAPFTDVLFRRACAQFATGVAIASVLDDEDEPHGLTINSFTSVSLDPPMVLICIDNRSAILPRFISASHFGISILKEEQRELSNRFAMKPSHRFEGIPWRKGGTGVPLLETALATMECAKRQLVDGGDHTILLAEVVGVDVGQGLPLLYFNSAYQLLDR